MSNISNIQPKRLNQLINEVMAEIEQDKSFIEHIRKEKVSLITDIFKCGKCLNGFSPYYKEYLNPTPFMFDTLYDKDLTDLELILAELSATLKRQAMAAIEWKGIH